MSRDLDFIDRWNNEKSAYLAWGRLISARVQSRLADLIEPIAPAYFLRTLVAPRLKDDQKLLEKAFYRGKGYISPYEDLTDKVGTRFVVLLGRDVRIVESALTSIEGWTFSRDRDYEEEQKRNPEQFAYAAVHFVVRPDRATDYEGARIPAGTPCEVQIKTLLQHAYSELTHDTIYKPQIEATPSMHRNAAKAMALLEATNDYFEKVSDDVDRALSSVRTMTAEFTAVYRDFVGIDPKPTILEGLLLEAYEPLIEGDYKSDILVFLRSRPSIAEQIKGHIGQKNPLFTQPSIVLVYYLVSTSLRKAKEAWPLTGNEMEPLLNDLGETFH